MADTGSLALSVITSTAAECLASHWGKKVKKRSKEPPVAPQPGGLVLLVDSLSCGLDASSWVSLRGLATEEQLEASCSSSPDVSLPGAVVERGLGQPAASCAAYTDGTTQAKER
jgi:hypothetical protein